MAGSIAAVIVAAGRGHRAGGDLPKQYRHLAGEPVIRPTLAAFLAHPQIAAVQPVIHPDDAKLFDAAAAGLRALPPVHGGATRQASVRAGLEALDGSAPDIVLIHDAARPFLTGDLISRAIIAGKTHGAAVPAVAVADTVKKIDERDMVTETLDRSRLRMVQTPKPSSSALSSKRTGAPLRRGSRIFPTTPRLPNGSATASTCLQARPPT